MDDVIILALDPGNTESGYAYIDSSLRPVDVGKVANDEILAMIRRGCYDVLAVEMIASYGMAVGADVFETCIWIGRFLQQHHVSRGWDDTPVHLVKRLTIKAHHCHSGKASDANVRQALVDRFASGVRNHGKGTRFERGWFHGFAGDAWQAYALAVYVADTALEVAGGQAVRG